MEPVTELLDTWLGAVLKSFLQRVAESEALTVEQEPYRPTVSHREPEVLQAKLRQWLSDRLGTTVEVSGVDIPESNGMSSETVLFEATWDGQTRELVARVAPDMAAVPVFPTYDLPRQFAVMKAVREHSAVPVPEVLWCEPDAGPLGEPFFVMGRASGEVPPDVMPYNFGSWVTEATEAQRQKLQQTSVQVLADLHAIGAEPFGFLPVRGLAAQVAAQKTFYQWVCADGIGSPLIERAFTWLTEHWPADEGPTVLNWGDARIGNMMFQDFEPVAVFDWEMAELGPPEVDLGWMIFLHRFFEDIAANFELPGLPAFMRRDDVAATYRELSGYEPRDLDFYLVYAALRHAIIMFRIQRRAVHFGDAVLTEDPDEMIMHHATLRAMLDGTYWEAVA